MVSGWGLLGPAASLYLRLPRTLFPQRSLNHNFPSHIHTSTPAPSPRNLCLGGQPLVVSDPTCSTSREFMELGAAVVREIAKMKVGDVWTGSVGEGVGIMGR